MKSFAPLLALLLLASAAFAQTKPDPVLGAPLFSATYNVTFRGIRAGELHFTLRANGGRYVYESIAHPRGLAHLVIDDGLREASEFVVESGVVKPLAYELDDGTKKTADDTRLKFDWSANKASGVHEDKSIQLALAPGVQDRMSAQVVLMQRLVSNAPLTNIVFIDRDELKEYSYKRLREESLKTNIGELRTVVIESSRPGSNRLTRLWLAPGMNYVPVRGEQVRKGDVETVFEIKTMK